VDHGAERVGQLHRERADPAGRAVDQHPLLRLDETLVAQGLQRGHGRHRHRGGLLERHRGRLGDDGRVLPQPHVLGEGAPAASEHLVPGSERRHVAADRLDLTAMSAPNPVSRGRDTPAMARTR
jgi:hypothetical protein